MGDRTNRRFMPADGHPRSIARRRQRSDLWRMANGAFRIKDAARIRRNADDARFAALAGRQQPAFARSPLIALRRLRIATPGIFRTLDHRTTEGTTHMAKLVVYNSMSLDGYFTDANGDMSWAHKRDPEWQAFVSENASGGGQLLFGRVTYGLMASFWPTPLAAQSNPIVVERMNNLQKYVF